MTEPVAEHPQSRELTVSIRVVRELVHVLEESGISRQAFLKASLLEPARLDADEARLSRSEVYRLCEHAIELTGNPALGLQWGERLDGGAFAPISQLLSHSPTLRDAFEALARFQAVLSDDCGYQLLEHDQRVTVRCLSLAGESPVTQRFVAEMIVTGLFRLVRSFNPGAAIERVGFAYEAPAYRTEYARVFEGAERFDEAFTGIAFDAALMSTASPRRDEDLHDALRSVVERRVLRMTQRTPYSLRVREVLVQRAAPQQSDMADVARALGISTRSLRRRLSAEGKSFTAILNEACALVAERLLLSGERTIQEAAYEIGFSDTAAFHRAFKRWTGMTPSEFRLGRDRP